MLARAIGSTALSASRGLPTLRGPTYRLRLSTRRQARSSGDWGPSCSLRPHPADRAGDLLLPDPKDSKPVVHWDEPMARVDWPNMQSRRGPTAPQLRPSPALGSTAAADRGE